MEPLVITEIENTIDIHAGNLGDYSLIKIINDQTNDAFICAILPVTDQTLFIKVSVKSNYVSNIIGDFIQFCSSLNIAN